MGWILLRSRWTGSFRYGDVAAHVLSLPIEDRASVAAELLASFDDDAAEDPVEIEAA